MTIRITTTMTRPTYNDDARNSVNLFAKRSLHANS